MTSSSYSVGEQILLNSTKTEWNCSRCGWWDELTKFITWLQDRGGMTVKHCECETCGHTFKVIEPAGGE